MKFSLSNSNPRLKPSAISFVCVLNSFVFSSILFSNSSFIWAVTLSCSCKRILYFCYNFPLYFVFHFRHYRSHNAFDVSFFTIDSRISAKLVWISFSSCEISTQASNCSVSELLVLCCLDGLLSEMVEFLTEEGTECKFNWLWTTFRLSDFPPWSLFSVFLSAFCLPSILVRWWTGTHNNNHKKFQKKWQIALCTKRFHTALPQDEYFSNKRCTLSVLTFFRLRDKISRLSILITMDFLSWMRFFNLTKLRPLFTLLHRGSDNSPLLIVSSAIYIDQLNRKLWPFDLSIWVDYMSEVTRKPLNILHCVKLCYPIGRNHDAICYLQSLYKVHLNTIRNGESSDYQSQQILHATA